MPEYEKNASRQSGRGCRDFLLLRGGRLDVTICYVWDANRTRSVWIYLVVGVQQFVTRATVTDCCSWREKLLDAQTFHKPYQGRTVYLQYLGCLSAIAVAFLQGIFHKASLKTFQGR